MGTQPLDPQLPKGVDDKEYKHIRSRMRASVLRVWRMDRDVIAGVDPWDVVDEAWISMAERNFQCEGPFLPFALRVAKNKAIDILRSAEARRGDASLDVWLLSVDDAKESSLSDVVEGSQGAEAVYVRDLAEEAIIERLALAEEAIYDSSILTEIERRTFLAVRVDGKSRAAVGRELKPPVTGQRVGQIVAKALIKIQAYVRAREEDATVRRGERDGR